MKERLRQILQLGLRECEIMRVNPVYFSCMIAFPIAVMLFFTSLMHSGQPVNMPVGVVDLDNTPTSRRLIRTLNSFQTTKVVAHYPNINEARTAMQRNEIYAFLLIPKKTTSNLMSSHQPKISFYYNNTTLVSGALLYRDLKTMSMLGSASVGSTTMRAKGYTPSQIKSFLQPISIDVHPVNNPWVNYNVYLSTILVPGCMMLFMFLITAYTLGAELKFKSSKAWLKISDDNIFIALTGKLLPQVCIFMFLLLFYLYYMFGILRFPHPGGIVPMLLLTLLTILAAQGFGIFIFGLFPSLRMSLSICSLWSVISFSTAGSAFPIYAMDPQIETLAQLFPLRHYYMIYQTCIFNGYPLSDAWVNILALVVFACLPLFVVKKIKRVMKNYIYIP